MDGGCTVAPFRGGLKNRTAGGGHGHPLCMEREVAQGESICDSQQRRMAGPVVMS